MQEQRTAINVAKAVCIKALRSCTTKRARAETRKHIKVKQKVKDNKKTKSRVPYTLSHLQNALDALVEAHYHKKRDKTVLSVRKAAMIYMDNKYSTLNRFVKKFQVIDKIKEMKR